jgi:hypothetical protein
MSEEYILQSLPCTPCQSPRKNRSAREIENEREKTEIHKQEIVDQKRPVWTMDIPQKKARKGDN